MGCHGWGSKQDRVNYLFFFPFVYLFESQFVSWPALGMFDFLTIDYLLVIKAAPGCNEWESAHFFPSSDYPHERCVHKLFVGKSIFDINQHFAVDWFLGVVMTVSVREMPDQSRESGWTRVHFNPWLPEKSVFRKMFLVVMQSVRAVKHSHSNHCRDLTLVSREAWY